MAAMAQVRHPNVLQILDYGSITVGGEDARITREYIVMKFISGSTLRSTMSEDGFFPEEDLIREWLMDFFLPVLDGMETLHAAKIIHRDLKMDEIQVANLQYVDFLNQQISLLTVETGAVRAADGKICLMLGEVLDGYEPIFFKEGRFHVKNPVHAACPMGRAEDLIGRRRKTRWNLFRHGWGHGQPASGKFSSKAPSTSALGSIPRGWFPVRQKHCFPLRINLFPCRSPKPAKRK